MTIVMPYDKLSLAVNATSLGNPGDVLQLLDAIRYSFSAFVIVNGAAVVISALRGPKTAVR
jgi:hypothetical protein